MSVQIKLIRLRIQISEGGRGTARGDNGGSSYTHLWRRHCNLGKLLYLRGKRPGRSTTAKGTSAVPNRQLPCGKKPWPGSSSYQIHSGQVCFLWFCFTSGRIWEILETEWGYSTFLNQTDTYVWKENVLFGGSTIVFRTFSLNLLTLDMKTVRHVLYVGAMLGQTKSLLFVLDVYDKGHAHCAHTGSGIFLGKCFHCSPCLAGGPHVLNLEREWMQQPVRYKMSWPE